MPPDSHSIVEGGFELTSSSTRLMRRTSLMMRLEVQEVRQLGHVRSHHQPPAPSANGSCAAREVLERCLGKAEAVDLMERVEVLEGLLAARVR